jgi:lantibiotic modifying enzyme
LRDTSTYARLLLHLLQPDLLHDGLDRSIEIEWLARPLSVAVHSPMARLSIYDVERRAMEVQDVPRFTTTTWNAITERSEDDDLLALGNGRTPETFYTRLQALSEADLVEQLAVIEEAVRERFALADPPAVDSAADGAIARR